MKKTTLFFTLLFSIFTFSQEASSYLSGLNSPTKMTVDGLTIYVNGWEDIYTIDTSITTPSATLLYTLPADHYAYKTEKLGNNLFILVEHYVEATDTWYGSKILKLDVTNVGAGTQTIVSSPTSFISSMVLTGNTIYYSEEISTAPDVWTVTINSFDATQTAPTPVVEYSNLLPDEVVDDMAIYNNVLYIAGDKVYTIDLTSSTSPIEDYVTSNFLHGLFVNSDNLFITSAHELKQIDVTNTSSSLQTLGENTTYQDTNGGSPFNANFKDVVVIGNTAYMTLEEQGMIVTLDASQGYSCTYEEQTNLSAYSTTPNLAFDVDIDAGSDFTLGSIDVAYADINADGTLTNIDVIVYEDNGGVPGTVFQNIPNVPFSLTGNVVYANVFGVAVDLSASPVALTSATGTTKYWVSVIFTIVGATGNTGTGLDSSSSVGLGTAYSTDGGITWTINTNEWYYKIHGLCAGTPPKPVNDNLCDATLLSIPWVGDYTNQYATTQVGEIIDQPSIQAATGEPFGSGISNSVWFKFEAPASGNVTIATDMYPYHTYYSAQSVELLDTQIIVYSISDCNTFTGTILAGSEDIGAQAPLPSGIDPNSWNYLLQSRVELTGLTAGEIYFFSVSGWDGEEGVFNVSVTEPLANDMACNATTLAVPSVSTGGAYAINGATTQNGEVVNTANNGVNADVYDSVWFKFVAPAGGEVRITTNLDNGGNIDDTQIIVYDVSDCAAFTGTVLGSNDDDGMDNGMGT